MSEIRPVEEDRPTAEPAVALPVRAYLLVLVTVTGAVVLALEILGTRVIGVHYGSSLYVWAALLTVTLICLAAGYALGGLLADRAPKAPVLCLLVMLAGGSVLLTLPLKAVLEPLSNRLGLVWGAIASAFVIFALPLTLLAMASPYVIRLRARRVEGVGATSGAVYALGTLGSVAGVLTVSLWMIPALGTRLSLLVCSAALVGLGALGLAVTWRARASAALLLAAGPLVLGLSDPPAFSGELFHCESPYGDLRVIQRESPGGSDVERLLMVNGIMQTGMPQDVFLVSRASLLQSHYYFLELLPYFHEDLGAGRRGVLIGLAGGMFPRVMEFYEIDWTAVEIDVKVAELAAAYFAYRGGIFRPGGQPVAMDLNRFPQRTWPIFNAHGDQPAHSHQPEGPYRGRAVIQDGRQYLASHPEKVDFIVLDAYSSDTIPFHLVTREFFTLVRSRLTDDGILAINYIGPPGEDFVTDSLFSTLAAVFGADNLRAWVNGRDDRPVQVMTVMALVQPMELKLWQVPGGASRLSHEMSLCAVSTSRPTGRVLTDNHNPVDLARAGTALQWRVQTRAALGRSPDHH